MSIDDSVRKLKKFQRDTDTTFIIISSFKPLLSREKRNDDFKKPITILVYLADVVVISFQLIVNRQSSDGRLNISPSCNRQEVFDNPTYFPQARKVQSTLY